VPNIMSRLWLNMHNPDTAAFAPLYVHSSLLPPAFTRGTFHRYDSSSYWWNVCVVANYASKYYVFAIKSVRALQTDIQTHLEASVQALELKVNALLQLQMQRRGEGEQEMIDLITAATTASGTYVNERYREFFPKLLTDFRDGYAMDTSTATIGFVRMFYPRWWLERVGYFDTRGTPGGILFAPPSSADAATTTSATIMLTLAVGIVCAVAGYAAGKGDLLGTQGLSRYYSPIPSPDPPSGAYHYRGDASKTKRLVAVTELPAVSMVQV